uniref:26S proteasome non-ATPase regulatory subunit 13 n=1 Tax=Caenorhabditis japonica TaxID=281687 RepID=A0A8R1DJD1_CAEJA
MAIEKVEVYLTKKQNAAKGPIADDWKKLNDHYSKKLWHQLTVLTRSLVKKPQFVATVPLAEFYENFVAEWELRANPLQLVEICIPIAQSISEKDKAKGISFLSKIGKVVQKDKVAIARLHTGEIELKLENKDKNGQIVDLKSIRSQIDSTQQEVDALVGVTEVHAPFYRVSSLYLREVGDFAGYYREALRYLGVEDAKSLTQEQKQVHAVLLGFAALLGENVHNFGELLAHQILKSLDGTRERWIVDVLLAFNAGDLPRFFALESDWGGWDDLKKQKDFLSAKIRLMAIMELALARPNKARTISFKEIATKCQIPIEEVEFLVMKALSKDLIRGDINQVEKVVYVTWVQPRVLDSNQIISMATRIAEWKKDVTSMEGIVSREAREILTQN